MQSWVSFFCITLECSRLNTPDIHYTAQWDRGSASYEGDAYKGKGNLKFISQCLHLLPSVSTENSGGSKVQSKVELGVTPIIQWVRGSYTLFGG